MNPFSGVRAPPESDERGRIRALSHRTAPPRPRQTDRTPRRTRNIAFARSRRFCTPHSGGSGNVASKIASRRARERSGVVNTARGHAQRDEERDRGGRRGVREDLWNFGDEVGLDEFLSNIPDGDEVSALGGVEKGKRGGNGLGNWDVLDEALSADIQSSAPVEVPGKKKSPPSSDLRPETPKGAQGDSGFGGSPGADRDSNGSHGGSGPGASKSGTSGGSGSGYVGSANDGDEAALDGLAKLSTALEMVRSQQIGADAHMGAVVRLSRWSAQVLSATSEDARVREPVREARFAGADVRPEGG